LAVKFTNRDGDTRTFRHDGIGRVNHETMTWQDASAAASADVIAIAYDNNARTVQYADLNSQVNLAFDKSGNVTQDRVTYKATPTSLVTPLETTLTSQFNAAGLRTSLLATTSASNTSLLYETYGYDSLRRLDTITQRANPLAIDSIGASFGYDGAGRLDKVIRRSDNAGLGNVGSVATKYQYNSLSQLTGLTHRSGDNVDAGTLLAGYTLDYDELGRLDFIDSTNDGTVDFGYDVESQLTAADYTFANSAITDFGMTYDDTGNRSATGYVVTTDNRTTQDSQYSYTYDGEGNRITRTHKVTGNVETYIWDARNRLVSVVETTSGGAEVDRVRYTYDPLNRRLTRSVSENNGPAVVEVFVNDGLRSDLGGAGDDVIAKLDGSGNLTNRYLHGAMVDQVLADQVISGGNFTTQWLLGDHQGTIRDIALDAGTSTTVTTHRVYDAYGNLIEQTGALEMRLRLHRPHLGRSGRSLLLSRTLLRSAARPVHQPRPPRLRRRR
jgi:YD repeat-containing protein